MSENQQRMRDLRRRAGMTQIEFAGALKVSSGYISMVERGAKEPSQTLLMLAERIASEHIKETRPFENWDSRYVAEVFNGLNVSQRDFAVAIGFPEETVQAVLSGKLQPDERLLLAVENYFNASRPDAINDDGAATYKVSVLPRSVLKFYRESKGMSQKDFAKATGYGIGYIQALEDYGARLSEKFAEKAAYVLGIEKEDLMTGSDHPPIVSEGGGTIGAKPNIKTIGDVTARLVPLISWSQAGTLTDYTDEVYDYEGHLAVDIKDPRAIAVRIRGDSMQPRFHEGDVAILSPSITPSTGDLVIARIRDQGVVFKRLQISGEKYQFISLNERYPTMEFQAADIAWIYPVKSVTINTL